MPQRLLLVVFVAYFSIFDHCETTQQFQIENGVSYILSRLFGQRSKPPVVLYIKPKQRSHTEHHPEYLRHDEEIQQDINENFLRSTQNNERAYILYHLLRTTMDEEEFDSEEEERLEYTKEFLRKAFIGRCQQLSSCVRKCPEPVKKCPSKCKQIFDDLDECDQPKKPKCPPSKCGHTMPPNWLL